MNKKTQQKDESILRLKNMHLSWFFISEKDRKGYSLNKEIAYYHAGTDQESILRIVKEFEELGMLADEDFFVHETKMHDSHLATIGITMKAGNALSDLGITLTPKI